MTRLAVLGFALIIVSGTACSSDGPLGLPVISQDSVAALQSDGAEDEAFSVLELETPDNSGEAVHPDYAALPDWAPSRYLVASPYTNSNTALENPTLYARYPHGSWFLRGTGPLDKPKKGYFSDPDMVAMPDRHELRIYYRQVTSSNTIWLIRTKDGVNWGSPRRILAAPNHLVVSPAVVRRRAQDWKMWSVNAGAGGCRAQTTSVELRGSMDGINWSEPSTVDLVQKPFLIWHIDVQWIESRQEYWAIYNVKRGGQCLTEHLFLATSADGRSWKTNPSPLLTAGAIPEFSDVVYRSTFVYNPLTDNIRFWYSGASWKNGNFVWRVASQRRSRSDVFAGISEIPQPGAFARRRRGAPRVFEAP
jgi:hypothetical protein